MKYISCIDKLNFIKTLIITLGRRNNANAAHLAGVRDDAKVVPAVQRVFLWGADGLPLHVRQPDSSERAEDRRPKLPGNSCIFIAFFFLLLLIYYLKVSVKII